MVSISWVKGVKTHGRSYPLTGNTHGTMYIPTLVHKTMHMHLIARVSRVACRTASAARSASRAWRRG